MNKSNGENIDGKELLRWLKSLLSCCVFEGYFKSEKNLLEAIIQRIEVGLFDKNPPEEIDEKSWQELKEIFSDLK